MKTAAQARARVAVLQGLIRTYRQQADHDEKASEPIGAPELGLPGR